MDEINQMITFDSPVVTTSGLTGIVRTFNEGDAVVELADGQWVDFPLWALQLVEQ